MKPGDTVLWTLINNRDHRRIECVIRFAMGGVQVEITSDGNALIQRLYTTGTETMVWAEEERQAWEQEG